MKFYKFLFLIGFVSLFGYVNGYSQSIQQELARRGLTFQQAQQLARQAGVDPNNPDELANFARQNGVPEEQIQEYLVQLRLSQGEQADSAIVDITESTITSDEIVEEAIPVGEDQVPITSQPEKQGLPYFGYDLFSDIPDPFLPSAVGPVDEGYVIGPDDELRLAVWGATEFQYDLEVDAEGRAFIPSIGQVTVAGQTLENLRESLKITLSRSYSGLTREPATVFMDLTVTRFKPIEVFVLGEVKSPGGYTFTSNSTLFNVLYGVGGPTTDGSLRDIRIIRNGQQIASVDLYELLLKGTDPNTVPLLNNDRIFIPPRRNEVTIQGAVRRSAIYEMLPRENIATLINYAGGLEAEAYYDRFQMERIIPFDERADPSVAREVSDLSLKNELLSSESFSFNDGDEVTIFTISDILENFVTINGAVYQPGRYELSGELITVLDLLLEADSLRENAYLLKADLTRTNPDGTQVFYSLDLDAVLNDDPSQNIVLSERDELRIYSRQEIINNTAVSIRGAVRNPFETRWKDSLRVFDLLFQAGGLFDEDFREQILLERADLIRRNEDGRTRTTIPFNLEEALNESGFGLTHVEPFDEIVVYPNTVQLITEKVVNISGAVKNPGQFAYREGMTLEDLLLSAGGFAENAYLGEVEITRTELVDDQSQKAVDLLFDLIPEGDKNLFYSNDMFWELLDVAKEIPLSHMDNVFIRSNPFFQSQAKVTVKGEVLYEGEYTIVSENELFSSIVQRAGGLTPEAFPDGAQLIRDSLNVIIELDEIIRNNKGSDIYVQNGDEIIIPKKPGVVLVTGNVALEGLFKYKPGEKFSYYFDQAGGMQQNTYKYLLLTQSNGATYRVKRKGLFKDNPTVEDGAVIRAIFEPEKPASEKATFREIFAETTAIITSALTIYILVDRL